VLFIGLIFLYLEHRFLRKQIIQAAEVIDKKFADLDRRDGLIIKAVTYNPYERLAPPKKKKLSLVRKS
jgi:hypothetical protein